LRESGVAPKNRDDLEQGIKGEKAKQSAKEKTKPVTDEGDGD
jgi:hypothetical protein